MITPLLIVFLTAAAARMVQARLQVDSAAVQAARAASVARDPAAAAAVIAQAALGSQHITCHPLRVSLATAAFHSGQVSVQVNCTVPLASLSPLRLPGAQTFNSQFTAPIVSPPEARAAAGSPGSAGHRRGTGG